MLSLDRGPETPLERKIHDVQAAVTEEFNTHGSAAAYNKLISEVNDYRKAHPSDIAGQEKIAESFGNLQLTDSNASAMVDLEWLKAIFDNITDGGKHYLDKGRFKFVSENSNNPINRVFSREFLTEDGAASDLFKKVAGSGGYSKIVEKTDATLYDSYLHKGKTGENVLQIDMARDLLTLLKEKPQLFASGLAMNYGNDDERGLHNPDLTQREHNALQFLYDNFGSFSTPYMFSATISDVDEFSVRRGIGYLENNWETKEIAARNKARNRAGN